MATRQRRLAFTVQRFKGFLNEFKRSKRGVLGVVIIAFFGLVAIFAPLISPLDPLYPTQPGYYPGQQPRLAEKYAVPAWYKTVFGVQELSENMEIEKDHEFVLAETFSNWNLEYPAQSNVAFQYSETGGNHDDDGCFLITYKREEAEPLPENGRLQIILAKEFEFPFLAPPVSLWMHYSVFVDNASNLEAKPFGAAVYIRRGEERFFAKGWGTELSPDRIAHKWKHERGVSQGFGGTFEENTFTTAGTYTYEFVLIVPDETPGREVDLTIRVDNMNTFLYGNSYGMLGTDADNNTPRDLFTMLVYGTRISFLVGILTAVFGVLIGLVVGLVSGYVGGLVDEGLMRFADFLLVLPSLPLLIVLVTVLGPSIWNVIMVLVFMGWMGFSRSVRSMVLSIRERPFIESAKAAGAGTPYIIQRHILPNVFALVYISLATSVPGAILSEASLAFLGLGDINVPSWGMILYNFSETETALVKGLGEYWFWVIPPGIAIALMAMAFILMGFALDEILNPKLRKRR